MRIAGLLCVITAAAIVVNCPNREAQYQHQHQLCAGSTDDAAAVCHKATVVDYSYPAACKQRAAGFNALLGDDIHVDSWIYDVHRSLHSMRVRSGQFLLAAAAAAVLLLGISSCTAPYVGGNTDITAAVSCRHDLRSCRHDLRLWTFILVSVSFAS